ncbi:unnamed protein product [Closterium sp. NIES-65]|nr:unnamed protein product [Closterium sp. NIES-65]
MAGRVSGSRSGGSRERRVGKGAWAPLQRLWGLLPQACVHCHWCASGGVFIATGAPLGECSLPLVRLWGSVHCHWCASGGVFIATGAPLGECSLPLVRLWGSVHCHWCASGGVFIATGAPLGECSLPLVRLWGSVHCHWCASGAPLGSVHCHWCASGGVFIATGAPLGECSLPLVRLWGSVHCHWCASGGVFIATGAPLWATPTVIAARAATASNGMGCRGKGGKWRERESAGGREGRWSPPIVLEAARVRSSPISTTNSTSHRLTSAAASSSSASSGWDLRRQEKREKREKRGKRGKRPAVRRRSKEGWRESERDDLTGVNENGHDCSQNRSDDRSRRRILLQRRTRGGGRMEPAEGGRGMPAADSGRSQSECFWCSRTTAWCAACCLLAPNLTTSSTPFQPPFHPTLTPPHQSEPERVFLVLKDDRVVRCMLPPLDRDPSFWAAWKDLSLDSLTINAFSPPPAPPVMQPWGLWGPSLKFLQDWGWVGGGEGRREGVGGKGKGGAEGAGESAGKGKGKPLTAKQKAEAAMKERVRRLAEERKETERRRVEKERELKRQREERIRMEREERRRAEREEREQQKQEEQEQRGGGAKAKKRGAEEKNVEARRKKLVAQVASQERWGSFYKQAANNEGVRFLIGAAFFVFFYFGIIVNVKKKRKDYEDRIKLERAAEEERRKMEGWEEDMEEMEAREEEEAEKEKEREKKRGKKAGVVVAKGKDGKEAEDGKGEGKGEGEGEGKVEEEKNQAILAGMRFMRSGAKVRRARKGKRTRRPTYLDLSAEVKFSDVAGLGEIRRELEEVVEFFQSAEKYRRRGSKIPSGILLCGEPGSGKTLLAKAVAGEAGVSFFSVSASQFVEIFVGVGASRVRALYNEARENAPSVVFIDELDAVGRQRGLTEGSGGQERDATLNQLLTCLDGFEGRGDVITIAATNRPDILDAALVRPGRFDRKIYIPKPSLKGRAQILEVHSRNKVLDDDVDFEAVAQVTDGMSGAELANVVDVAALRVLRENRSEITTDDMLQAAMLEEGGYPSPHEGSPIRQRQLALNEAALAVVAFNFRDFQNIQLITVVPRMTEEKGSVRYKLVDTQKMKANFISASCLRDFITVQLAPMVADEMWNGAEETCTIWADHADVARRTARQVALNGLSAPSEEGALYGIGVAAVDAPWRREAVDADASRILEECRTRAAQVGVVEMGVVAEGTVAVGASEEAALYGIGVAVVDAPWRREAVDADASRILETVPLQGCSDEILQRNHSLADALVDKLGELQYPRLSLTRPSLCPPLPLSKPSSSESAAQLQSGGRASGQAGQGKLLRNRSLVDALVDKLIEEKAMGGEEFASLARQYGSFDTPPPSPVEMRDRQLARFREAMMAGEKERAARVLLADPVAVE